MSEEPVGKVSVGDRFARWTVLALGEPVHRRATQWRVRCECGAERLVPSHRLLSGESKSCGCLKRELATRHGAWQRPEYKPWAEMIQRCTNQANKSYKNYGGRGITVCDEWRDFGRFLADMGQRPDGTSIDRIDNDRGYYRENCRWATRAEQSANQRHNGGMRR